MKPKMIVVMNPFYKVALQRCSTNRCSGNFKKISRKRWLWMYSEGLYFYQNRTLLRFSFQGNCLKFSDQLFFIVPVNSVFLMPGQNTQVKTLRCSSWAMVSCEKYFCRKLLHKGEDKTKKDREYFKDSRFDVQRKHFSKFLLCHT